jgi:hypothetical protein
MHTECKLENQLGELGTGGRIILKRVLNKLRAYVGFTLFRIRDRGELL